MIRTNNKKEKRWLVFQEKLIPKYFSNRLAKILLLTKKVELDPEIIEELQTGGWLFITGTQGTGKTVLAASYMLQSMKHCYMNPSDSFLINHHLFITGGDILDEIKTSFKTNNESDILAKYYNIPFLVIDDLGAEKLTDWSLSSMYKIINARYEGLKATIITSNCSGNELASLLDMRIAARIGEMSTVKIMKQTKRPKAKKND